MWFLMPLLPEELIEPRDIPQIEFLPLLYEPVKDSLSLRRLIETSADSSEAESFLLASKMKSSTSDLLQIESLAARL